MNINNYIATPLPCPLPFLWNIKHPAIEISESEMVGVLTYAPSSCLVGSSYTAVCIWYKHNLHLSLLLHQQQEGYTLSTQTCELQSTYILPFGFLDSYHTYPALNSAQISNCARRNAGRASTIPLAHLFAFTVHQTTSV